MMFLGHPFDPDAAAAAWLVAALITWCIAVAIEEPRRR